MNGNDSGAESLREGLSQIGVTEIIFDPSVTQITLTGGELVIDQSLTINGSGMGGVEVIRNSPSNFRIFHITNSATVTITGLTISGGNVSGEYGGGILIEENSNLSLDNCVVSGNIAYGGGGITVYNNSSLSVSYCLIISNLSQDIGGGIYADLDSYFTIRNSLISNNSADGRGGGGILIDSNTGYIYNSTFTGNAATSGGSINGYGGAIYNAENLTLINVTIANNHAQTLGGGIYNGNNNCIIGNTIVANNTRAGDLSPNDCVGMFNSLGYNLIGDSTDSNGFNNTGDIIDLDPMLGVLGNYGGPTQSIPLLQNSPALGAGNYDLLPPGENSWDQRGLPYNRRINGQTDIGAFEDQSFICYSGKSKVLTRNISTNIVEELNAENVFSDLHEVYDIINHIFVPVKFNIITRKTTRFMLIKAHTLAQNEPFEDFYVTSGHKLLINGKKIKARYVQGAIRVKVLPETLYSICTPKSTVILVNGLNVTTWGYENWIRYSKSNGIGWRDNQKIIINKMELIDQK